jgi:hypothetical protein
LTVRKPDKTFVVGKMDENYYYPEGGYQACHGINSMDNLGFESTYGGQSSFISPVEGKKVAWIAMFDIWKPENPIAGRYIWLPVEWKNGKMSFSWRDSWNLGDLGQNSKLKQL